MADSRSDVSLEDVISSLGKTSLPEGFTNEVDLQQLQQLPTPESDLDALIERLRPQGRGPQGRGPYGAAQQGTFSRDLPPEAIALLDTIAGPESKGAYNVRYGGAKGPQYFEDYTKHPHIQERISSGPDRGATSGAAGRYQFLYPTWVKVASELGLQDFSPRSQDLGAWYQAQKVYARNTGRNLLADLQAKDPNVLAGVGKGLATEWASLEGGAQPTLSARGFANKFMQNLQGGPQPGGAQPVQPQVPPNTYPLKLPSGGTLHVPNGVSEEDALAQAKASGIPIEAPRQIKLPNGGTLTAPAGVSDEEAIRTAAQHIPELQQFVKSADKGKDRDLLSALAGNVVGGAEQFGGSFLKGYAEMGLPGAETAKEYSKKMLPDAEKRITEIPEEEIAAAEKEGLVPGLVKKAEAKFLLPAAHMVGRYGAEMIPAGRAITAGKLVAEHMASLGDITKRAEDAGTAVEGWKAHAAAGISSILANVGIPHVLANGVISKVLGGASEKTLLKAFERGGLEEANKLLGSRVGALVKDIPIGLGTATGAGFGVMAGTEAAQRAALGQPMQTPEELKESLEAAAWLSPMALPGAVKARGERGKYVDYLQQQKELKEAAVRTEQENLQGEAPPPRPKDQPDKEFPDLTVGQADLLREAQKQQEAPTPEPPAGEAAAPKEPVSATYNVDTDVGSFPVEVTRSPDGSVSIDSGEGPFGYSAKSMAGKTDADILAQHFAEAGFKSAAPAGEAPKEAPKTEEVKVEEPAPPSEEKRTSTFYDVNTEDSGALKVQVFRNPDGSAAIFDGRGPVVDIAKDFAEGKSDADLIAYHYEPEGFTNATPEKKPTTPAAEPHFAESVLGLKPVKDKRSLYQKLLKQDINTPEGREAITDLLHKTTAKIEPENLVALQKRMEELDAQQITEAGAPDGRGGAQPSIREEGRDQAVSGEGVEPSRQGEQAAEVSAEKAPDIEDKLAALVARVGEMQEAKKAKKAKAPKVTEAVKEEEVHPLQVEIDKLNTQLAPVQAAIVDLNAQRKAAQDAGDKEGVSAATTKIQKLEAITRAVKDQIKRHNETMQAERDAEAEKTAAQARKDAKRKVEEQGGYEEDLDAPIYSRGEKPVEATRPERMREAITSVSGEIPTPWNVKIHSTIEEAQKFLDEQHSATGKAAPKLESDAKAFVLGKTAHFITDNIPKGHELGVLLHEVGDHLGMEKILDEKQRGKLQWKIRTWAMHDKGLEGDIARAAMERARGDGSEHIAYFVEEAVNRGVDPTALKPNSSLGVWFRQLMAAFKSALRKLGISKFDKLTAQDIVDMAYGAAHLELRGRWHGGPHEFRKFQLKYRGTGEGGLKAGDKEAGHFQDMIGWGHYMSGRRGIAEEYRDRLTERMEREQPSELDLKGYNPDPHEDFTMLDQITYDRAENALLKARGDFDAARENLKEYFDSRAASPLQKLREVSRDPKKEQLKAQREAALRYIDEMEQHGVEYIPGAEPKPTLYSLGINAFDHELLDWEKPLSQQSAKVKRVFNKIKNKLDEAGVLDDFLDNFNAEWDDLTGRELYRGVLHKAHETDAMPELFDLSSNPDKAASEYLDALGVKGIKYPVAGGRLSGNNYVIFSDKNVHVAGKNAKPVEYEDIRYSRKSPEEKQLEQSELVKSEPSDSVKAAKGVATAVKNVTKALFSSEYRDDLISEAGRKLVARSHGLAKALEPYETFSDWGGVRADINQNQLDNMSHILSNMWKMGGLDISKGGLLKITNDPKHALYNWGQAVRKLPISEKSAFSIMRALIGEAWEKEAAQRRTRSQALKTYADTLSQASKTAQGKTRDRYRDMATRLYKEARKLAKDAGAAPFEGMERKVTQADIDAAHELLRRHSEVKEWVDQGHKIHRNAVDFMQKTGTIDAATAADWKSRPYIPLFKAMEDLAATGDGAAKFVGASAKGLSTRAKKGTGHTEAVNVMENMYKSLTQLYVSSAINHTRTRAIDQLRGLGMATRTNADAKDAVLVKRGGKEEYWKVSDPAIFEALKESPVIQNAFLDMMAAPAGAVRSALIKHPGYWAKSVTREPLTANFTSRTGFVAPHQVLGHVVRNFLGGSKAIKDIERYGYSGVLESQLDPARFSQAVSGLSGMDRIRNFWNKTHTAFDSATRGAVYDAAMSEGKKRGLSGEKLQDFAAMKASEFANFATRGTNEIIHEMGRHTPFMRAALNSLDNLYRNATGSHLNYREKKQARELFRSRAAGMAYMSAVYALAMINDPDYLNAPASDWTMNFFAPGVKKDKWTPINAGFETAVFFKAFPELLVRLYSGTLEPQEAGRISKDLVAEKVMPPLLPLFPQLLVSIGLGYDINLGRELESAAAQGLAPELRDMNASAFAKLVSKKLDTGKYGISPDKLENIGRSVLGGVYDMGLTLADAVIAHTDPDLLYNKNEIEKYPLLKGVEIEKKYPKNVAKAPVFYEAVKAAEQVVDSVNKASARASKEDLDKLLKDPEKMAMYKISDVLRDYRDRISSLRNAVEAMGHSELPTPEKEKRAMETRKLIHTLETDAAIYAQKFVREKK